MYTMLWKRAISRTQFSPLNFLRPSLPSRVIPSWSLQHPTLSIFPSIYPLIHLSPPSHSSFHPYPASSAKMPNETRTIHGCAHRETTSILSQSILQNVNSNRIIRTANAKQNQIYLKQLQITWHIFLVNCSFLIGNLINPKCHENHWTSLDQRTKKKFSPLFQSNPTYQKKETYHRKYIRKKRRGK